MLVVGVLLTGAVETAMATTVDVDVPVASFLDAALSNGDSLRLQ